LKQYAVSDRLKLEVTETIASRSALKQRKLTSQEVRDIIETKAGISLPIEIISKSIRGSEYAYVVINYKPQYNGRTIVDEVTRWKEVVQADEVHGDVDLVILTQLKDSEGKDVVDKIKEKFKDGIVKITSWIVE